MFDNCNLLILYLLVLFPIVPFSSKAEMSRLTNVIVFYSIVFDGFHLRMCFVRRRTCCATWMLKWVWLNMTVD